MSNFVYYLIVGLVAGILAKAVMPGSRNEPGGWIMTIILGLIGGVVGGWLGSLFGIGAGGIVGAIIMSAIGAIVVICLLRLLTGNRRAV